MSASSQPPASAAFPGLRRDTPYPDARRNLSGVPGSLGSQEYVSLAHPQHPQTELLLLTGYSDRPVWHRLALDAAYVLSGNRRGYLSTSLDAEAQRIPHTQECLPSGHYYYLLEHPEDGESPSNWKVVPTFESWTFPHEEFSARFPQSTASGTFLSHWRFPKSEEPRPDRSNYSEMSIAARHRDGDRCVLSGYQCDSTNSENCRLIPQATGEWFKGSGMGRYRTNPSLRGEKSINDVGNGILLRSDLHGQFDGGKGLPAWLPYPVPSAKCYVASYCLTVASPDYADEFHDIPLNLGTSVSESYLFARFAWSILQNSGEIAPAAGPAEAIIPQAGRHLGKHDRELDSGSTRSDDILHSPGQDSPDFGAKEAGRPSGNQAHRPSRTTAVFSDDPRLDKIAKHFVATHPAIRAIGEPERMSSGMVAWLEPLDGDERRQYET